MASVRGAMFIKLTPGIGIGIGLQCPMPMPVFLRQQVLGGSFNGLLLPQEIITRRSLSKFSVVRGSSASSNSYDSSSANKPSSSFGVGQRQSRPSSKRELLLPVSSLVDAKIVYSAAPAFGHNQEGHPECKARVAAILKAIEKAGFTDETRSRDIVSLDVKNRMASVEEVAAVHTLSYVKGLKQFMEKARANEEKTLLLDTTGPTYATQDTYREAMLGAGASLAVVDHVVAASRETATPPIGFALVRPPGHHAVATRPMGFCVFGNVAVAARHAQQVHGLQRVFIVDFDVHHGNGTNDIFYEDPNVYYLSTHQAGSFPGTGKMSEVGEGRGEGTSLNLPLPGGSGDEAMSAVFDEIIAPAAQSFGPDIILVSAGYDAHYLDQLAGLQFTTGTYYRLASSLKQLAEELCGGRCCFFLEGGYDLGALSNSVVETFRAFLGEKSEASRFDNPAVIYDEPSILVRRAIDEIKSIHSL